MTFFNRIFWLACLRYLVYLRQRLGWMTLVVGLALVPLSMVIARASFVGPLKIFWDFSLGLSFLLQVILSTYLSSHVLEEERARKTLHILCAGRVTRSEWVFGQTLGIWALVVSMGLVWFAVSWVLSLVVFGASMDWILIQSQVLVSVEVAILVSMGFCFSLYLRATLTWLALLALSLLLHSVSTLIGIFEEKFFQESMEVYEYVFKALYLLPPLEWFDLRLFVGYEAVFDWGSFFGIFSLGVAWTGFWLLLARRKMKQMDL